MTDDTTNGESIDVPDFAAAHAHVLTELRHFTTELEHAGVTLPAIATLDTARALSIVGLSNRERVRTALQATVLSNPAEYLVFDSLFPPFWQRLQDGLTGVAMEALTADREQTESPETHVLTRSRPEMGATADDSDTETDGEETDTLETEQITLSQQIMAAADGPYSDDTATVRGYSAIGQKSPVDPELVSGPPAEEHTVADFVDALLTSPGRRSKPATTGQLPDARRALRSSLQTGGVPIDLPTRTQVLSERNCCVLIDVSGSVLDTLNIELLLSLVTTVTTKARHARVFLFDTELTEATDAFSAQAVSPLTALRDTELTWGGGTQIGRAFDTLRRTAPEAVDRRTAVLIISDGLDVGADELLSQSIVWLAHRSAAILWLNPLAVSPVYEPTARGMATCLPFVDGLFGFSERDDLAEATRQLIQRGLHGPIGYKYDRRYRQIDQHNTTTARTHP